MTRPIDQPYAISLTSIPPRFDRVRPVLDTLLAQQPAPAEIVLCIPERYDRFPGAFELPALPGAITVVRNGHDLGPGTKAIMGARHVLGRIPRLIYCDDDWLMGPDWAQQLLTMQRDNAVVTGQGFGVDRLGRVSECADGFCDIAQGFAGVLVDPDWVVDATPPQDPVTRSVDDIWLSAHLAAKDIVVRKAPLARQAIVPAYHDIHGLQDHKIAGHGRAEANKRCAAQMAARHGIWPES